MRLGVLFLLIGALSAADFEVGRLAYEKGDYATALKEWQPLADIGAPFASYNLGLMYAKGQGVKQDYAQAAKWYMKAAEKGIPEAQYNLGVMYSNGTGVPRDYSEASKWFHKAAEKGDANAANSIGTLYNAGEGSFKNYSEAAKWYRQAAEAGNSNAQFNLGVMYDIGQGVQPDFAEAEKWYRKAAEQWNDGALCNLAILYYNGEGLKRDLVQSHEYFTLAKEAGDPRADNLMELTTEKLSKKQQEKAKQMAEDFKNAHRQQIATAKNPIQKPPSQSEQGPETAGLYGKAVKGADEGSPGVIEAPSSGPSSQPAAKTQSADSMPNQSVWSNVDRIVAVGDVHGDYEQFAAVLRSANLIDGQDNWVGGKTHLVQTGDVVDEGPDSRRIMDLLAKLERQASAAGGYVHCLIGNHEAMDVYGDLRFVSPAGFGEYRDAKSDSTRDRYYSQELKDRELYAKSKGLPAAEVISRNDWLRQHPPGFFEQREAFAPQGVYGRWIRSHNSVVQINGILFSHAGLSPKYASYSLEKINRMVRDELTNQQNLQGGIVTDLQGPLWYSGLADGAKIDPAVEQVLQRFHVTREVVAHLDAAAAIMPSYGGKVIMIDVGLSRSRDNMGTQACLIVERDKLYALHRGKRLELPKDDGADMLRYLKQAAALDPEPSPLAARIQTLEAKIASK